jgi:hypothetical protein
LEVLAAIKAGTPRETIEAMKGGRNAYVSLMNLGIIDSIGTPLVDITDADGAIREAALESVTLSWVSDLVRSSAQVSGEEVGDALAQRLEMDWSVASKRRHGAAMKKWALWTMGTVRPQRKRHAAQPGLFDKLVES